MSLEQLSRRVVLASVLLVRPMLATPARGAEVRRLDRPESWGMGV